MGKLYNKVFVEELEYSEDSKENALLKTYKSLYHTMDRMKGYTLTHAEFSELNDVLEQIRTTFQCQVVSDD